MRVDSRAHCPARPRSPSATRPPLGGVLEQVDEEPAEGGEEVGHRCHVDEGHVERHAPPPFGARCVGPGVGHAGEQRVRTGRRPQLVEGVTEHGDHFLHGGPLGGLVAGGHGGHGVGVDEGLRSVEHVERRHQDLEAVALRRSGAAPRRQPEPVPQAAGQREGIDCPLGSELVDRGIQGQLQVAEISGDVVAPEEGVRKHAPADEDLVGELAPQHAPVGHALAGALLGQGVKGAHPRG